MKFNKILFFYLLLNFLFSCSFEDISSNNSNSDLNENNGFLKGEVAFFEENVLNSSKTSTSSTFFAKSTKISDNDFILQENSIVILYAYEDTEYSTPIAITKTDSNGQFTFTLCDAENWANSSATETSTAEIIYDVTNDSSIDTDYFTTSSADDLTDTSNNTTATIDCTKSEDQTLIQKKLESINSFDAVVLIKYTEDYQNKYYMMTVLNSLSHSIFVTANPFQAFISQIVKNKLNTGEIALKDMFQIVKDYQDKIISFDNAEDKNTFVTTFLETSKAELSSEKIETFTKIINDQLTIQDITDDTFQALKNKSDLLDDSLLNLEIEDNPQPYFKDHNAYIIIMKQSLKDAIDSSLLQELIDSKKNDFKFIYIGTENKTYLHYQNSDTPTVRNIGWLDSYDDSLGYINVENNLYSNDTAYNPNFPTFIAITDWLDVIYEENDFNYILFIGEEDYYYSHNTYNIEQNDAVWKSWVYGHNYTEYVKKYGLKIGHLPFEDPELIKTVLGHWKNYREATDIEYRKNMLIGISMTNSPLYYIEGEVARKMAHFIGWKNISDLYDPITEKDSNSFGVFRLYFNSDKQNHFPWHTVNEMTSTEINNSNLGNLVDVLNEKKFGSLYINGNGSNREIGPYDSGGITIVHLDDFENYTNLGNQFFFYLNACSTASSFPNSIVAKMMEKGAIGGLAAREFFQKLQQINPYLDETFANPNPELKNYMTCSNFGDLRGDESNPFQLYGDPSLGHCSSSLPILKVTHKQNYLTPSKGYAFDGRINSTAKIYLHNVGHSTLKINTLNFDNDNNNLFEIDGYNNLGFPIEIPPSQSLSIKINFKAQDNHSTNKSDLIITSNAAFWENYKIPFTVNKVFNLRTKEAFKTIQSAIDVADKDDTIAITKGIYYENLNIKLGKYHYNYKFKLLGTDIENTIIDGQFLAPTITASLPNIQGLTIQHGIYGGIKLDNEDLSINDQSLRNAVHLQDIIIQDNIGKFGAGMAQGRLYGGMSRSIDYYLTNIKFKNNLALEGAAIWDDKSDTKTVAFTGSDYILKRDRDNHLVYLDIYDFFKFKAQLLDINIVDADFNINNDYYDQDRKTFQPMLFLVKNETNSDQYDKFIFIDYFGRKTETPNNLSDDQKTQLHQYVVDWQTATLGLLEKRIKKYYSLDPTYDAIRVFDSTPDDLHLYAQNHLYLDYNGTTDTDFINNPTFLKDSSYNDVVILYNVNSDGSYKASFYQHNIDNLLYLEIDPLLIYGTVESNSSYAPWFQGIVNIYNYLLDCGLEYNLQKHWPSVYYLDQVTFEDNMAFDTPNIFINNKNVIVKNSKFDYWGSKMEDFQKGKKIIPHASTSHINEKYIIENYEGAYEDYLENNPLYIKNYTYANQPEYIVNIEFSDNYIEEDTNKHFIQSTFNYEKGNHYDDIGCWEEDNFNSIWSDSTKLYFEYFEYNDQKGFPSNFGSKASLHYVHYKTCSLMKGSKISYYIPRLFFNSNDHFYAKAFAMFYEYKTFPNLRSKSNTYDLNKMILYDPQKKTVINPQTTPMTIINADKVPFTGLSTSTSTSTSRATSRSAVTYDEIINDTDNPYLYYNFSAYEEYAEYDETRTIKDFYYKHGYNHLNFKWNNNNSSNSGAGFSAPASTITSSIDNIRNSTNILFGNSRELTTLPDLNYKNCPNHEKLFTLKISFNKNFIVNSCVTANNPSEIDCKIKLKISFYDQNFNKIISSTTHEDTYFLIIFTGRGLGTEADDDPQVFEHPYCTASNSIIGEHTTIPGTPNTLTFIKSLHDITVDDWKTFYNDIYYLKINTTYLRPEESIYYERYYKNVENKHLGIVNTNNESFDDILLSKDIVDSFYPVYCDLSTACYHR